MHESFKLGPGGRRAVSPCEYTRSGSGHGDSTLARGENQRATLGSEYDARTSEEEQGSPDLVEQRSLHKAKLRHIKGVSSYNRGNYKSESVTARGLQQNCCMFELFLRRENNKSHENETSRPMQQINEMRPKMKFGDHRICFRRRSCGSRVVGCQSNRLATSGDVQPYYLSLDPRSLLSGFIAEAGSSDFFLPCMRSIHVHNQARRPPLT